MSDALKHECGIALVRLLKPLEFYKEKYGTAFWNTKMYLWKSSTIVDKMVLVCL
jgi:amidophosphoribosyltransferase